ncbi:DUF3768 domain-containing protein [Flavobacteriaceae bacterium MHTCC 0001]
MTHEKSKLIAQQNDEFRKNISCTHTKSKITGSYSMTEGVLALSSFDRLDAVLKIKAYDNFNENNDPHGEHDCGRFQLESNKQDIIWKIYYYDTNYKYGSEDPSDLSKTRRVLTVMLPSEY